MNQNHVKNNRKQTKCYLCLQEMHGKHTKEHVISKVLFRPFQISNPILLNACLECNKKKGYEEEYVARQLQATSSNIKGREALKKSLKNRERGG